MNDRIIKFRVWDKENKKLLNTKVDERTPGFFICFDGKLGNYSEDGDFWTSDSLKDFIEIMQFTGLLDKNGKEIYEGDIVEDSIDDSKPSKVEFIEGCFCTSHECLGENIWRDYEVIGNIHENPDILKK